MRRLGGTQAKVLDALRRHGGWSRGCGWVWTTDRATERYMDRFVEMGLATVQVIGEKRYYKAKEK